MSFFRTMLLVALLLPARSSAAIEKCDGCNVIIISMTNMSANRMSLYGYARKTTPRLEKWAEGALVFENAFAHASWTLPESVSILTSLYPYSHRVWQRAYANSLGADVKTLPEILRDKGYATAAFTGGLDYHSTLSQMRGFQTKPPNPNFTGFETTFAQSNEWLKKHSQEKFFLLVQGYDAHCPFVPAKEFKGRFSGPWEGSHTVDASRCVRGYKNGEADDYKATYSGGCPGFLNDSNCRAEKGSGVSLTRDDIDYLGALYDEVLLKEDARVADFLESLDPELLRKTIVVVTSDHGEMFAKHGRFGRAGTKRGTHYDDVLHVPLLLRLPAQAPRRIDGFVQHIDLMPTVLDLLDVGGPAQMQGKSLLPLIRDGAPVNEYVYSGLPYNVGLSSESEKIDSLRKAFPYWSFIEAVRGRRWKLIHERLYDDAAGAGGRRLAQDNFEFYDIRKDPEELHDLSRAEPEALAAMKARLKSWSEWAVSSSSDPVKTDKIPEEILKQARARGYWQ